jgi:NAD(P)-dependent dehydrogenase (short-subunit alcohol dehydrogenase family)
MSDRTTVQELFDLSGRTALITGASGLLGTEMAAALAEVGCNVVVSSTDLGRAEECAAKLPVPVEGQSHHGVSLDLFDQESLASGFADAVAATGGVDILVNNANAASPHDLTDVTGEIFDKQMRQASAYFLLARHLRDHVVERKAEGNVVMIGSMYGVVGSYPDTYEGICKASPVQYHTLKGGIVHMTRHLAAYWARDGVRVNCLSPGPFPGEAAPQEMVERLKQKSPMARMGKPHELKGALILLVSDAGSYITGQNLLVDGGWTAW